MGQEPKLKVVADRHGKSVAQVLLKWQVQDGVVVLPKSVTPSRIEQNADLFGDFELTEEDVKTVESFDMGRDGRLIFPVAADGGHRDASHPHYPFNAEF